MELEGSTKMTPAILLDVDIQGERINLFEKC